MNPRLKFILSVAFACISFAISSSFVWAVPVRTYGTVDATSGHYSLHSDNTGNGNLTPGSIVTVDSYLLQCRSHGSAACSTQWNSDATLVNTWHDSMSVPQLNQADPTITQNFSLPAGQCGRIQYDQGIAGIPGAIGGWVHDFGVDCGSSTNQNPSTVSQNTCSAQQPVNTQFRQSGNSAWISGNELTNARLSTGQFIDVNCFAKNGSALLDGGVINMVDPSGRNTRISNSPELRNFQVTQSGQYTFTCQSSTVNSCSDVDSFSIQAAAPSPSPSPSPIQQSSCNNLQVTSGNNSLVPATLTFQASGSDNMGNIQRYHFFFGDGQDVDTDQSQVSHQYLVSGTFFSRVSVQDSRGNWTTSSSCETTVTIQSAPIESHKSDCSDIFITSDNSGRAPSNVTFEITGFDNKGDIQGYRLDFGNGTIQDSSSRAFQQLYTQPGTFQIRGYIKDSSGNWVGGNDSCNRTLSISSTQPLTTQPSTGTPTALPLLGLGSGITGVSVEMFRRRAKVLNLFKGKV